MKKIIIIILFTAFIISCLLARQYLLISFNENTEKKYIELIEEGPNNTDNDKKFQNPQPNQYLNENEYSNEIPVAENNFKNTRSTQDVTNVTNDFDLKKDEDCILYIDEIDLSKLVYTGKNREQHLEKYELVTATDDMRYKNGGNYIVCGHASRLYGHSLNRLKEVKKGYHIRIRTDKEIIEYIVDNVFFEKMDNTDAYCKQSGKDEITIISCAKYISPNHYIIVHAVK